MHLKGTPFFRVGGRFVEPDNELIAFQPPIVQILPPGGRVEGEVFACRVVR
jgi:hypothetical protein